jgi:hypothetical protein
MTVYEINNDASFNYTSPIVAMNQEIRRKNVVAAAAVSSGGPSDPWESIKTFSNHHNHHATESAHVCACPPTSPRHHRGPASTTLCGTCGKRSLLRARSISYVGEPATHGKTLQPEPEPQHALALLQSTPQLRVLCPGSTDMQGLGQTGERNMLAVLLDPKGLENFTSDATTLEEYRASLVRDRANRLAASELANLLWILAHEMSLEEYGIIESEVFSSVFGLVHSQEREKRMAGLACVDALLAAPSADEEKKGIKFANTLSTGLRAAHGDFEFLRAVSRCLGHMATRTANVDFVESEVTRALEWLRTERSDRRYVSFEPLFL